MKDKKTSWGNVASWYDETLSKEDTFQSKVILPNLLRILPPEKGKRIIDIACGQGFFSKIYAEGGGEVLGVDISSELIKIAQKNESEKLRFKVANAQKISGVKDESFDSALIILALQNIKDMPEAVKEASRVLVKNGKLVIVLNHPCFRVLKGSSWEFDEKEGVQYRRVDKYGVPFSVEVDMNPGAKPIHKKVKTVSFHRPLQDYFKALNKANFVVSGLEEWISHKQSQSGPRAVAEDRSRKEFPMFLAIIAEKR